MLYESKKQQSHHGLTMLEMVIALALMAIVFAAVLPQFKNIENSWAAKKGIADALQNGRVFTDHINRSLAQANRITAVSDPAETNGFIEFEDNAGKTMRYQIGNGKLIQFGDPSDLYDLAGPVTKLQFTCYAITDLDTPITDPDLVRFVKVETSFANLESLGTNQDFTAQVFLRTNAGLEGIVKGTVSSFGITTGNTPALANITPTNYLCAYTGTGDDGWAVVLKVDTAARTVTNGLPFEYDIVLGQDPHLAQIDLTHYLCAYSGAGSDGWAVILAVDTFNWTISKGTPLEFDATLGTTPALAQINATHYLCAYTGPGSDGLAVVLTVNAGAGTISAGTPFEFDAVNGEAPALARIDNDHYLCAYSGSGNDGWAVVLTVNPGTWTISSETPFEFDTLTGITPALAAINSKQYLCAYAGPGAGSVLRGWAVVLNVNPSGWSVSKDTPFEFDPAKGEIPALIQMNDNSHYLCTYGGSFEYLWATVLVVDTGSGDITNESTTMLTSNKAMQPDLAGIDDISYLCAHEDQTNNGWAMILTVGEIRP